MSILDKDIKKIGIVGSGVIGASWAAYFLARGFDVSATDPGQDAEKKLNLYVEKCWPVLDELGLSPGASLNRLTFNKDLAKALCDCDFIQENGPERIDIKRALIRDIDAAVADDVLIATSSSGIVISDIQDAARHPERILLGHPFNPPHLIPLVEIVGGKLTSPDAIQKALSFYSSIGKKPICLRREMKGHIANRLQAALIREAIHLLEEGVASAADIDAAVAHGPGLRWALSGPFITMQLAGGEGGIAHALDHLGPALETWWEDLGQETAISKEARQQMIDGVADEMKTITLDQMVQQRDEVLVSLIALKTKSSQIP